MELHDLLEHLEHLFTHQRETVMTQLDDLTAAVQANTAATNALVAQVNAGQGDLQPDIDAITANTAALQAATAPPAPVDTPAA